MIEIFFTIAYWAGLGLIGSRLFAHIGERKMCFEDYLSGIILGPFSFGGAILYAVAIFLGKVYLKISDFFINKKGK